MKDRVACAAASQPPRMPKPTCLGANLDDIVERTEALANFDVMRRKVFPTAIGRMPPSFFSKAHKEAPYMISMNLDCTFPDSM